MGDRCTGACCEKFTLTGIGRTPEDIRAFLQACAMDGAFIADMIVPLYALTPGAVYPDGTISAAEPAGGGWVMTCRHFDAEARACLAYDQRPRMCRDFPYRRPCEHVGCTWDAGRAGLHPHPAVVHQDEAGVPRVVRLRVLGNSAPARAQEGFTGGLNRLEETA